MRWGEWGEWVGLADTATNLFSQLLAGFWKNGWLVGWRVVSAASVRLV